jgi:hypothetical protein
LPYYTPFGRITGLFWGSTPIPGRFLKKAAQKLLLKRGKKIAAPNDRETCLTRGKNVVFAF